jgi:hypothetical protein
LEQALSLILAHGNAYGWLRIVTQPLVAAYSQSGATVGEARGKIEQFGKLCRSEEMKHHFDRAVSCAFDPARYAPDPERYGLKREWFVENQVGSKQGRKLNVNRR